jgi:flagellar biosynthesis component FlhA
MPQAETAVEAAIYSLGGKLFARIINPLVILFVAFSIAVFLYIIFINFYKKRTGEFKVYDLLYPLLGLTIMLGAIGITFFIGNTGNEIFQGPTGGGAVKGINDVVQPINIR